VGINRPPNNDESLGVMGSELASIGIFIKKHTTV
jgi:hypothetical protein